ncbi:MAG TPA: hypothetical protein PLZ84_07430, partial [Clostridia bacterium]|nr:hypothetical protein [Clostridia bacterium]
PWKETLPAPDESTDLIKEVYSCFETGVIKYSLVPESTSYKIAYGTEPGNYTHEIYGFKFNIVMHENLRADKISIPGLENGRKYYVRLYALKDDVIISQSREHVIVPGFVSDTGAERAKLASLLEKARKSASAPNMQKAIAEAEAALADASVNRSTIDVAIKNLIIGMAEKK